MSAPYAIGDIDSQEKGSAARANKDKPMWSYMPLAQISELIFRVSWDHKLVKDTELIDLHHLTGALGKFQAQGTKEAALNVLEVGTRFLMQATDTDFDGAMCQVIKVWQFGERQYARFNWMKGMAWSETINSAQRHVMHMFKKEAFDADSKLHHGAHFICNAMMMVHYAEYYKEGNDLPIQWFSS